MIVTISGQAGSGKSTVARLLANALGYRHYSIGDMRRSMAQERGMTLAQLNFLGEKEDFTDRDVDEFQERLGKREDNLVIDGRTSWYFIPASTKIYLDAGLDRRAERVFRDERASERFSSVSDAVRALEEREESDRTRYAKLYNIDVYDKRHYDIVVDTTDLTPDQIVDTILVYLGDRTTGE